MSDRSGVTLSELMVTVTIIGILAAVAVPGLAGFVSRDRIKRETDFMAGVIMDARIKSMQNAAWQLQFQPEDRTYLAFCDHNGNGRSDAGEELRGPFTLDQGIAFGSRAGKGPNDSTIPADGVSFVDNRLIFNRMGSCNSGTIYLRYGDDCSAIRVMPASGMVYIWFLKGEWVCR